MISIIQNNTIENQIILYHQEGNLKIFTKYLYFIIWDKLTNG
jgi:hypothetical protein